MRAMPPNRVITEAPQTNRGTSGMLRTVGQKTPCGALCFASFLKQLFPRGDSALHPPSTGGSSLEPPNVTLRTMRITAMLENFFFGAGYRTRTCDPLITNCWLTLWNELDVVGNIGIGEFHQTFAH